MKYFNDISIDGNVCDVYHIFNRYHEMSITF